MRRPLNSYTKITTRHAAPVAGSRFGKHLGTDYATPIGTTVLAPVSGVVRSVTTTPLVGKQIELAGNDGYLHRFAHLSVQVVTPGQRVREGQSIGHSGNTGSSSTGPHLHWDTRKGGTAWDASFGNYIDNEAALSAPAARSLVINAGEWNARTGPGLNYSVRTEGPVKGGQRYALEAESGGWAKITFVGKSAWISPKVYKVI